MHVSAKDTKSDRLIASNAGQDNIHVERTKLWTMQNRSPRRTLRAHCSAFSGLSRQDEQAADAGKPAIKGCSSPCSSWDDGLPEIVPLRSHCLQELVALVCVM